MGDLPSAQELTVVILKSLRDKEGVDAAMKFATEMIYAAAGVLAHEKGYPHAAERLAELDTYMRDIPTKKRSMAA